MGETADMAVCPLCGASHRADASDTAGSWKQIRIDLGYCNICAIGEERARKHADGSHAWNVIADGKYYSAGKSDILPLGSANNRPNAPSWDRGFGGARWDVVPTDGRDPFTTYSLWHGGTVAPHMADRMPNNARFLTRDEMAAQGHPQ